MPLPLFNQRSTVGLQNLSDVLVYVSDAPNVDADVQRDEGTLAEVASDAAAILREKLHNQLPRQAGTNARMKESTVADFKVLQHASVRVSRFSGL